MKPQFIEPTKGQIEYIIGIDFGHGETSAAICRVNDNRDPEDIDLTGTGCTKIPSTLYIDQSEENEVILIGKDAINRYKNSEKGNFYAYFKNAPSVLEEDTDNSIHWMKLFMKKVYDTICVRRAGELMNGSEIKPNHVVFIACPSQSQKWDDRAMQNYVLLARNAGLPIAGASIENKFKLLGIVRESRAAYIRALQKDDVKQYATKGILVVDYGSSTIDITYYKEGDNPIDRGYPLGASEVERGIFDYLKEPHNDLGEDQNPNIMKDIEIEHPNLATAHLYSIRESKEKFYTDYNSGVNGMEVCIKFRPKIDTNKIDIEIPKDTIANIILKTYITNVSTAFEDFKKNIINDNPVTLMVLTGGASRMNFVEDTTKRVFGEKVQILPPQDPSLTVSNGIATAGRADVKLYHIAQNALNCTRITSPDIFNDVIQKASRDIARDVIEGVHSSYKLFKTQYWDESVVSLKMHVAEEIQKNNLSYNSKIQESFINILNSYICESVDLILKNYVNAQFPEFDFSQVKRREIQGLSINISDTTTNALEKVTNDSIEAIEDSLLKIAIKVIWNISALLFAAMVKFEAEIGTRIFNLFKSDPTEKIEAPTYEDIYNDLEAKINSADTKLDRTQREKIYNVFNENKSSYETKLSNTIKDSLEKDSNLKDVIAKVSKEAVLEYVVTEINEIQKLIK